jgi:hypothetical protein
MRWIMCGRKNEVRRSKVNCVVTARGDYSVSVRNIFRERTEESGS